MANSDFFQVTYKREGTGARGDEDYYAPRYWFIYTGDGICIRECDKDVARAKLMQALARKGLSHVEMLGMALPYRVIWTVR